MRSLLPPHSDMLRVLDVLGWPGAPETRALLDPADRRTLQDVVYATLILALEEGEKGAYHALRATPGREELDVAALVALESLARLALRLQTAGRSTAVEPVPPAGTELGQSLVSPALSALADSLVLPVWITDAEFTIEWANPAFATLVGADLGEISRTPLQGWCDASDLMRFAQVMEAARLEQRNWSIEIGVGQTGDVSTRLLMVAAPRLSADGLLLGWTGICFDVTRNATLWTRLDAVTRPIAADTARTQMLLRQLPGMIWTTDLELRCTFSHGASFLSLGAAPNQLVGRTIQEIVGSDDPQHQAVRAHEAALEGDSVRYQDTYGGRIFDARVEPMRDPRGGVSGCIGLAVDVTDRMEQERRQQQLSRQLSFGQRIGRIGSWEVDVSSGDWLWSDEAFRLLGADPGGTEPSFNLFLSRVHPDDRARLQERHAQGVRSALGYEIQYRLVRFDGEVRQMRGVVEFEHDVDGVLIRVAGILQDVTPLDRFGASAH